MKRVLLSTLSICIGAVSLFGQYNLTRDTQYNPSLSKDGIDQIYLTSGGLNSPQVHLIDIDGDGSNEMYIFDKTGNVHLGFHQTSNPDVPFVYDPSLTEGWPDAVSFSTPRDFDNDGVVDLFTFSSVPGKSSIEVYKGFRQNNRLNFELVLFPDRPDDLLFYDNNGQELIVYHAISDVPAIEDFDNDGDLDIVNFEAGGTFMYFHENIATGGSEPADFFQFIRRSSCYGGVLESATDGTINLASSPGTCATPLAPTGGGVNNRSGIHPGSTITATDLDGDGDLDLLLGDINSDFMTELINEPVNGTAFFTQANVNWPRGTTPVQITFFPAAYPVDFDEDGINTYLVSPTNQNVSQNFEVLWRYEPSGEIPGQLSLAQRDFISNQAFDHGSGAHITMGDLNGDGVDDFLVGNDFFFDEDAQDSRVSELALYTSNSAGGYVESFPSWLTALNAQLSPNLLGLDPLLQDMDNDGDLDLLLGSSLQGINYAENRGSGGVANFPSISFSWMGVNPGQGASPAVIDVNGDGLLDLLVGLNRGSVSLYLNQGSASNPQFSSTSTDDFYGAIDTRIPGFNSTAFARPAAIEINGEPVLYVGSGQGRMLVYTDLPSGANDTATLEAEVETNAGFDLDPCFGRDAQGTELTIIGNERGGMGAFRREGIVNTTRPSTSTAVAKTWKAYPNPTRGDLRFDGVETGDVLNVFSSTGQLVYRGTADGSALGFTGAPGVYSLLLLDAAGQSRGTQHLVVLP